ncbi:outer membrane protein assembly factor BamE [Novosphingobium rosa]|uniref:outer membrane protein assembly factor BamE n=1 Tax=Novosphingobium rosa TaxID=76978 RepID=UPI00082A614D|nr:outer membrane protein assembly factor BamE [Novosphingobium rosa]
MRVKSAGRVKTKTVGLVMGAAALSLLAGGCTSIRDHRGYLVDTALVDSVMVGIDNRQSVEHTLGRPTFVSQYGKEAWYYVSMDTKQTAFHRPRTTAETILRVSFDPQGNVARLDRAGTEKVVRLNPDGSFTPTLGKKRSFFEDLFGNIGTVGTGMGGGAPGAGGGGGPGGT